MAARKKTTPFGALCSLPVPPPCNGIVCSLPSANRAREATELGVLLARYGEWEQAREVLLHGLAVEVIPYARLFGADAGTAYLEHTVTSAPIVCEGVDTVVLAQGHQPDNQLAGELSAIGPEVTVIGDALSPRTAEEAVLEGLTAAWSI